VGTISAISRVDVQRAPGRMSSRCTAAVTGRSFAMLEARYANHFKVGHNEHEFVFDFAQFHFGPLANGRDVAETSIVRIVMGPPFARALLDTLVRAVGEYEDTHGPINQG
jgi:hypothetical protein